MKKVFSILLILTMLSGLTLACNLSYIQPVSIRVIDEHFNPIENAQVKIYYQVTSSITQGGEAQYAYTSELNTDQHGSANFTLRNKENNPDLLDCNIRIHTKLFEYEIEKTVDIDEMPKTNIIQIPTRNLIIQVSDNTGFPIETSVFLNSREFEVKGKRVFRLPEQEFSILILHEYAKKSFDISLNDNLTLDVVFNYVPVQINVLNDLGDPLEFNLKIANKSFNPKSGQKLNLLTGNFPAIIEASGIKKEVSLDTITKKEYLFVFDFSAPKVNEVIVSSEGVLSILTVKLEDPGSFSSGVENASIRIVYPDKTSLEQDLEYIGGSDYQINLEKGGNFNFTITAVDKEGNQVTTKGQNNLKTQPLNNINNNTDNDSEQNEPEEGFKIESLILQFDPVYVVLGILGLVGLAFLLKERLEKKEA